MIKKKTNTTKKNKKLELNDVSVNDEHKQGNVPNIGCCCTCKSYPKHFRGYAMPCRVSGKYVARKAKHPECYNCKY